MQVPTSSIGSIHSPYPAMHAAGNMPARAYNGSQLIVGIGGSMGPNAATRNPRTCANTIDAESGQYYGQARNTGSVTTMQQSDILSQL